MVNPIVSICIITYNSEATIIRTLESAKEQTYENIELIISDDGSLDNTISVCKDWLKENYSRFTNVEILTVTKNTGVPANCNRALYASKGQWLKFIAGDDCLLPNCINDFLCYVQKNHDVDIVFSNYYKFSEINNEIKIDALVFDDYQMKLFDEFSPKSQLSFYLNKVHNITPSLFYKRDLIINTGGFNEKYKLFEDTPLIVKLLLEGVHFSYLETPTVLYRVGNESITRVGHDKRFYNIPFVKCNLQFKKDVLYPIFKNDILFWIKEISFIVQYYFTIIILRNKKNKYTYLLYSLFKALNPYYLINYIRHL